MAKRNHAPSALEIADTVASRTNELRANRGYTLDDLAKRAGITKSHVWEIEQGRSTNPTVATCVALSRALGVSLEYLIGITSKAPALHPEAMRIALEIDWLLRGKKSP